MVVKTDQEEALNAVTRKLRLYRGQIHRLCKSIARSGAHRVMEPLNDKSKPLRVK